MDRMSDMNFEPFFPTVLCWSFWYLLIRQKFVILFWSLIYYFKRQLWISVPWLKCLCLTKGNISTCTVQCHSTGLRRLKLDWKFIFLIALGPFQVPCCHIWWVAAMLDGSVMEDSHHCRESVGTSRTLVALFFQLEVSVMHKMHLMEFSIYLWSNLLVK